MLTLFTLSCSEKKEETFLEIYNGPNASGYDIDVLYTEYGTASIKLTAPIQTQYESGDKEFPKGMFMEFFKPTHTGLPYSDLKADFAHYYNGLKHWKLTGNVVYRDILKNQVLRADEIFWKPSTHKLWSDGFVHITAPGRELMGDGLEALDDFSWYTIKKPRGRREKI